MLPEIEFEILDNIIKDLNAPRYKHRRVNKLTDKFFYLEGESVFTTVIHPENNVSYYSEVIKNQLSIYETGIRSMSVEELSRTMDARDFRLAVYYKQALKWDKQLDSSHLELSDVFRIMALKELSVGFIVIAYWVYQDNGIYNFMQSFFKGLTDDERFDFVCFAREHGDTKSTFDGSDITPDVKNEQPAQVTHDEDILVNEALSTMRKEKKYNLLEDYPRAKQILENFVPDYLNADYSLKDSTSKAKASVIAYAVAKLLGINEKAKYFETLWGVNNLKRAFFATQQNLRNTIIQIACLESNDHLGGRKVVNGQNVKCLMDALAK